jgi:hypothetical protein
VDGLNDGEQLHIGEPLASGCRHVSTPDIHSRSR